MNGTPTAADVEAAAARLSGIAVETPLLESALLNDRVGRRIVVKAEPLQRTGSFKFRGACNRLAQLTDREREAGVVAYSSGNHGQGVAAAAWLLGLRASVVMPADAPAKKLADTAAWGAEVITYQRGQEEREPIARALARRRGAVIVPPFDDPRIIAGQGTVGLELARQADAAGLRLDAVLIPCSGGGLAAGIALAFEKRSPATRLYTVEPAGFDDTRRSLAAGHRLANADAAASVCDALMIGMPGELTFPINAARLAGGLVVEDVATCRAMAVAFDQFRIVVEPSGAVALAAALEDPAVADCPVIGVILSGGNVDLATCLSLIGNRAAGRLSFPGP